MRKNGEHFVTCGQMKVLERRADENGLSYYRMMENAGEMAAAFIMESAAYWNAAKEEAGKASEERVYTAAPTEGIASGIADKMPAKQAMKVYVFCGKGNNGGDGLVVARLMHDKGYDVTVVLVDGEPKTQDSITNLGLVKVRDIKMLDMAEDSSALMKLDGDPDIIVDAIYGTGFKGRLKSNGLKAAIYINSYSKGEYGERSLAHVMVAALDIPSGLGGDVVSSRELDTNSVSAHLTVTFHAKKPVHVQKFAEEYCGEIFVADIGIDEEKLWNIEI